MFMVTAEAFYLCLFVQVEPRVKWDAYRADVDQIT
jgi:hypothetical protein